MDRMNDDIQQLYIASILTSATDGEFDEVTAQCAVIVNCVQEISQSDRWPIIAYDPVSHTSPRDGRGSELSPEQIWHIDTEKVLVEGDAIIGLAVGGGSYGAGMELQMASDRGVPILIVHDDATKISRMVRGMPGVTVRRFERSAVDDYEGLRTAVRLWLRANRSRVESGPRWRRALRELFRTAHEELCERWSRIRSDDATASIVAASARMTPRSVDEALAKPERLSMLPAFKFHILASALNVPVGLYLAQAIRPAPLSHKQRGALDHAALEHGWTEEFRTVVENVGRQHLDMRRLEIRRDLVVARNFATFDLDRFEGWVGLAENWMYA